MEWKSLSINERYEKYTLPYYVDMDNQNQVQEFASEQEELAVSERNMDAVVDYAREKAELDDPPIDLKKYFGKLEKIKKRLEDNYEQERLAKEERMERAVNTSSETEGDYEGL